MHVKLYMVLVHVWNDRSNCSRSRVSAGGKVIMAGEETSCVVPRIMARTCLGVLRVRPSRNHPLALAHHLWA